MQSHVSDLKGIGIGKTALLIGGGMSARNIPEIGDVRINCNYPFHGEKVDYVCYYDDVVEEQINEFGRGNYKTVGFEKLNNRPKSDYYAVIHEDIIYCDTGHHTLQLATKIMMFDEVYLIGYDYCRVDGRQHYYDGAESNEKQYDVWMYGIARHRYEYWNCRCVDLSKCKCEPYNYYADDKVYNLSPYSELKCFPGVAA